MNQGIMLNIDDTHFMHSRWRKGIHPGLNEVRQFVRQYEGTQVTDLVFDVAGRIAGFPAKTMESWIDKYLQKEECGQKVDYTNSTLAVMYDLYEVQKIDPYAVWLEEARAIGIRPWISVRMNDCHCTDQPVHWLHSNFYHEHPELYRVRHREGKGYFDRCFDYGEEAVRARMLAFIAEVLERYDVDGLEMDWQRECFCFRPGDEYRGIEIMNEFMRAVSRLRHEAEEKRGHAIKIGVRMLADPEDALEMGFDVSTWAREGHVDVVAPAPRWATCDTDMPIGLWKRLLQGSGALLAPCIEILLQPGQCKRFYATKEQVAALAAQHFALGGDMTYLFNYFDDPKPEESYWENELCVENTAVRWRNQMELLRAIGDPDMADRLERRHTVCERDLRPMWREKEQILPFTCETADQYRFLRLPVGNIPANAETEITLGLSAGKAEDVVLYAHRQRLTLTGQTILTPDYTGRPVYTFKLPNADSLPPYLLLEVSTCGAPLTVDYIDCHVAPEAR